MRREASNTLTPQSKECDAGVPEGSNTPSPNAVQDFGDTAVTNASDIVSDAILEHIVLVTGQEVIEYSPTLALPELTEVYCEHIDSETDFDSANDIDENDETKTFSSRSRDNCANLDRSTTVTLPQRILQQALSSLASPVPSDTEFIQKICVGNERQVLFYKKSLGVRLNRGIDGYVRILSVSDIDDDQVREGDIYEGDIVREVNGVNLRMPIDMAVWKMTIELMKMASRPLKFVLAEELFSHNDEINAETSTKMGEDRKSKRATRGLMNFMKRSSAVETNVTDAHSTDKGLPPTLEELSEETLTSVELDQSRDALDDGFDECMLTPLQINNLL